MAKTSSVVSKADHPPSQNHHHDHEHHHHHSHYERTVDEDGTVYEKTVTEEVVKESDVDPPAGGGVAATTAAAAVSGSGGQKGKQKKKVVEEVDKVVDETITASTTRAPPGSPTPSHHSHRSHHPEVIVNVNVPTNPAPAPPAVQPAAIPLPASAAPSPAASVRSMQLPKFLKSSPPKTALVEAVPEEDEEVMQLEQGDEVVIKLVTTTTTTRRAATPPKDLFAAPVPVPTAPPVYALGYVECDPDFQPLAPLVQSPKPVKAKTLSTPRQPVVPPPPVRSASGSPQRVVERTTVETFTYPISEDTAAMTMGGPTTKGIGGVRTAALSETSNRGTKAGIQPIPYGKYRHPIQRVLIDRV